MASSGNFSTMNPLVRTTNSMAYTIGNLRIKPSSNWSTTTWARGTMVIPSDKKIYFESRVILSQGYHSCVGIGTNLSVPSGTNVGGDGSVIIYNDTKYVNGTLTNSFQGTVSNGDVYMVAVDGSNRKVWIGVNGTWSGSGDPANGTNEAGTVNVSNSLGYDLMPVAQNNSSGQQHLNFGQDSTFGGGLSAGGNADDNGFGDFKYSVPTGFLALCSANLSISEDIDPAETDDDYPAKQFNCTTYTGNSTDDRAVSLDMAPDLVVVKERGATNNWYWFDSTRGGGVALNSNLNSGTHTDSGELKTFTSTGFTLGTSGGTNNNTDTYAAWGWKANGGTTSSNSEGNITSTVQANTKAGFSIITYTGSGGTVSGANPTFGHGLESAPDFLIFKCTSNSSTNWICWHSGLGGANKYLSLNATTAEGTDTAWLSNTAPSSTLITTDNGGWGAVNGSGRTNICYAWHNVEGMQKFGYYEGNGNADGPFVYTGSGFRPRMIFIKSVDNAGNWEVRDTARSTFNADSQVRIYWNSSSAEGSASTASPIDFLSNGFKVRGSNSEINTSTIVYGAWGDVPFKYNNTF